MVEKKGKKTEKRERNIKRERERLREKNKGKTGDVEHRGWLQRTIVASGMSWTLPSRDFYSPTVDFAARLNEERRETCWRADHVPDTYAREGKRKGQSGLWSSR